MKRNLKDYINLNTKKDEVTEVVETEEVKEEETMEKVGFFARHKKGLLIGGGLAALGGLAAILLKNRSDDGDEYEDLDCDDDDAFEDEAAGDSNESEE
jgi:hypothetical protein